MIPPPILYSVEDGRVFFYFINSERLFSRSAELYGFGVNERTANRASIQKNFTNHGLRTNRDGKYEYEGYRYNKYQFAENRELDHERLLRDERYFLTTIDCKSAAKGRFGPALWKFVCGKPPATLRVVHPKRSRANSSLRSEGGKGSWPGKQHGSGRPSASKGSLLGADGSNSSGCGEDHGDDSTDPRSSSSESRHADQVPHISSSAAATNTAVAAVVAAAAAAATALRDSVRSAFKSVKAEPGFPGEASKEETEAGSVGVGVGGAGGDREAQARDLAYALLHSAHHPTPMLKKRKTPTTDDFLPSDLSRFVPSTWPDLKKPVKKQTPKIKLGPGLGSENPQVLAQALLRLSQSLDE